MWVYVDAFGGGLGIVMVMVWMWCGKVAEGRGRAAEMGGDDIYGGEVVG